MASEKFQKDSIGWQWQQLQQRVGEWWEWQLQKLTLNLPDSPQLSWGDWAWLWEISKIIAVILLILLVSLAIWRIWQQISLRLQAKTSLPLSPQSPADTRLAVAEWLERSRQYQQQGNYFQACRCLYFAMLQQLHDRQLVSHQASRTDNEYRLAILSLPHPEPYETLLSVHQQLCFGTQEATPSLLQTCQRAYREIDQNA